MPANPPPFTSDLDAAQFNEAFSIIKNFNDEGGLDFIRSLMDSPDGFPVNLKMADATEDVLPDGVLATKDGQLAMHDNVTPGGNVVGLGLNHYGVAVRVTNNPTTNGSRLKSAYTKAKTLTPGGNALSATNRVMVLAPPGHYDFGDTPFTLDAEFVDVIGLSAERGHVLFTADLGAGSHGTIVQTANDVRLMNFVADGGSAAEHHAYWPSTNLPKTICKNVEFKVVSERMSMRQGVEYSGTYIDVVADNFSFGAGAGGIASGLFIRCEAKGDDSYTEEQNPFGADTASGTFIECEVENEGFATGGTASGTFIRCKGGSGAFAGERLISPAINPQPDGGTASGTFEDCEGGAQSFGGGNNGTASGTFDYCRGGGESFGGGSGGTLSGKLFFCRLTFGTYQTPSGSGKVVLCIDGNGDTIPDIGGGGAVDFYGVVENVAELKDVDHSALSLGTTVRTLGRSVAGDGGSALYELRQTGVSNDEFLVVMPNGTEIGGNRWHLLTKEPRVFHALKAGSDRTGATDISAVVDAMIAAAPDDGEYTTLFFPAGTYKWTDIDYNKTLNKKIRIKGRAGKTYFVGDDSLTKTQKGQQTLFRLHSDFKCTGVIFQHFGSPINGGDLGVTGSSDDSVKVKVKRCGFENCGTGIDFEGGGTSDGTKADSNTIDELVLEDLRFSDTTRLFYSRIKKYNKIRLRHWFAKDANDDEDFLSSALHAAIRIGQDHGAGEGGEDDEHFKTVESCILDDINIKGVSVTGDMVAYGALLYIHQARIINSSIGNIFQDFGGTKNTKPVTGTYLRGRDCKFSKNYYYNASNGSFNGMLHLKAANQNTVIDDNHFEITQDYIDNDNTIEPIGISAEKAANITNNVFRNVFEPIAAFDETNTKRTCYIAHNIMQVTLTDVTQCRIIYGGWASFVIEHNIFRNGGQIRQQQAATTGNMKISRILRNEFYVSTSDHINSQITIQRHPVELQEIIGNVMIQDRESALNRIQVSLGDSNATLIIDDNYIKHPSDVGTWSTFFDAIAIDSGTAGKLCRMYRNKVINVKGRGIRYQGAHDLLDIEDPHIEGATSDPLRFDGATPGATRIVSRTGQFKTMNKGVASVTTTSTTIAHGVDAVDQEGRDAIENGEIELRVIGDISPATHARAIKSGTDDIEIILNDTPAASADIQWIASRTDQFA